MHRRKRESTGVAPKCLDSDGIVRSQYLADMVANIDTCNFVFSYILVAFSEILVATTILEYAFTKAPKNMRSLVMSALLSTGGIAAAMGEAFVCKFFPTGLQYPELVPITPDIDSIQSAQPSPPIRFSFGTMRPSLFFVELVVLYFGLYSGSWTQKTISSTPWHNDTWRRDEFHVKRAGNSNLVGKNLAREE